MADTDPRRTGEAAFDPVTLEADALTCVRGGRTVFRDVSLRLQPGQPLALKGPNGCGKSSLLRLLAGLSHPAEGLIRLAGVASQDDAEGYRSQIHYVGHAPAIKTALTVRQNIAYWPQMHGVEGCVNDAIERFDLGGLASLPAKYLSDGQRRRTALARIVAVPLPIWLLDEPTTGLDDASVKALGEVMVAHLGAGGIIIAATHGPLPVDDMLTLVIPGQAQEPDQNREELA